MPAKDQAAYMREYRKRQRRETIMDTTMPAQAVRELVEAQDRIRELESEVARLKRELAKAHSAPSFADTLMADPGFAARAQVLLSPVKTPLLDKMRRDRQSLIDATLAKVNRKTRAPK